MIDSNHGTRDLSELELLKAPEPLDPRPPRRPAGSWFAISGLVAAAATAAYVVFGRGKPPSLEVTSAGRVEVRQQTVQPLGGNPERVVLPPLDDTDPLVRELVKQITSHPRVAAWLATEGLVRNFVAAVSNFAEGRSPARQLRVLRPPSRIHVVERAGQLYIDPDSYRRYDGLAAAVASVDPAGTARVYATLKPRLEEANSELGAHGTPFDRTVEQAIMLIVATPSVVDPVRVEPRGGTEYRFADPELEALTAAQKQLLRTGPDNLRKIQTSVRAVALALGIPAERLTAPKP